MNKDQITSAVRWLLTMGAGVAVGAGFIDEGMSSTIIAAVAPAIGTLAWSLWSRRAAGTIAAASALADVRGIVTTRDMADVTFKEDPKVVSSASQVR